MTLLWIVLAAVVLVGGVLVFVTRWRRERGFVARTHSHNDYAQLWPLVRALRLGFASVEADIWAVGDQLCVAHDRHEIRPRRTLRRLYLDPLAARVRRDRTVLATMDGPFQLLVEIKDDPAVTYPLLHELLAEYADVLSRYDDGRKAPGAIDVVITGHVPREAMAAQDVRYAACDGTLADVGTDVSPELVPLCSDRWGAHFSWRGVGPMPDSERAKLRDVVEAAHREGRKVRFWGLPRPTYRMRRVWRELEAAGVDYLNADNLPALRRLLNRLSKSDTQS